MSTPGRERSAPPRVGAAAWCLVLLAAGLEIVWALALTKADGLRHPGWAATGITVAIISLVLLTLALRSLTLTSAYTVWVGVGAVGVALVGAGVLGEALTPLRAACLALVVAGVIGLTRTDAAARPARTSSQARDLGIHQAGEH